MCAQLRNGDPMLRLEQAPQTQMEENLDKMVQNGE